MYNIDDVTRSKLVAQFREEIGCGLMTAKKCLAEADYVYNKAIEIYKSKGHLGFDYCMVYKKSDDQQDKQF